MLAMMESTTTRRGNNEGGGVTSSSSSSSPATVSSTSHSPPPHHSTSSGYSSSIRQIMLSQYSPWVMSTYGDSAKTKTITARKYSRILGQLRALSGSGGGDKSQENESLICEDSKFKLWVKTKGFTLGPPNGHPDAGQVETMELLYIPTGTVKTSDGKVHFVYKKVAMVEQFFDIIYSVHVESAMDTQLRGRSGKHCGQKRTYRAVADQYAFIPREAISKFLLYCVDCQRKNFGGGESRRLSSSLSKKPLKNSPSPMEEEASSQDKNSSTPELCPSAAAAAALSQAVVATMQSLARTPLHPTILATRAAAALIRNSSSSSSSTASVPGSMLSNPPMNISSSDSIHANQLDHSSAAAGGGDIDLSLPITSTYLRRMRALGFAAGMELQKENVQERSEITEDLEEEEEELEQEEEEEEEDKEPSVVGEEHLEPSSSKCRSHSAFRGLFGGIVKKAKLQDEEPEEEEEEVNGAHKMSQLSTLLSQNGSAMNLVQQQQQSGGGHQHSEGSLMDTGAQDDASSNGAKEDEDEDEDDELGDERIEGIICGDPEKLKAFNMFVRLFVDENLDRHVPISKQPKEKIQAIIDSCTRQFPEHACRARKRIRTYLKSCRRTKRTREQAGLDPTNTRPTPPHLTSVQAEQLLARACENEAENAKRMRMGMEPISQPMPIYTSSSDSPIDVVSTVNVTTNTTSSKAEHQQQLAATLLAVSQSGSSHGEPKTPSPQVVGPMFPNMNGNAMTAVSTSANTATLYRQPFPAGTAVFPTVVSNPPPLLNLQAPIPQPAPTITTTSAGHHNNGSMSNEAIKKSPLLNHKLNTTEMAAVRQLITGYRESAAFLLRSADELEQLLQIQPKL